MRTYAASGLASCQRMLLVLEREQHALDQELLQRAQACTHVTRLQTIPGVGPMVALAIHAAVGDVERFATAKQLCSYAGLVPSVRQSGSGPLLRSGITHQGNVQRSYDDCWCRLLTCCCGAASPSVPRRCKRSDCVCTLTAAADESPSSLQPAACCA